MCLLRPKPEKDSLGQRGVLKMMEALIGTQEFTWQNQAKYPVQLLQTPSSKSPKNIRNFNLDTHKSMLGEDIAWYHVAQDLILWLEQVKSTTDGDHYSAAHDYLRSVHLGSDIKWTYDGGRLLWGSRLRPRSSSTGRWW